MLHAQRCYGDGAPSTWDGDGIALGKRIARQLPEDRFDPGIAVGADGAMAMAADVRLDNRDELATQLGLHLDDARRMSDAAFLLRAWERWEAGALDRIVGDFAFALWDSRCRQLFLARDFLGQKPLCYSRRHGFAAFASMPAGLHALPEIPPMVDISSLRRFVALAAETGAATFFTDVRRVEPGHLVRIDDAGERAERYWRPSLAPIRFKTDLDYVEAVRETLDRSVASRLRGAGERVAAHLSAGLDSSAVTSAAARLVGPSGMVTAFTAVPGTDVALSAAEGRLTDEGPLAAAVADSVPNVNHVRVGSQGFAPLEELERGAALYQRPLNNLCNYGWATAINDAVRDMGIGVLLTGQAGNFTLSHSGSELLPLLAKRARIFRLLREAAALKRNGASTKSLAVQTLGPLLPRGAWSVAQRWRGAPTRSEDLTLLNPDLDPDTSPTDVDYGQRPGIEDPADRVATLQSLDFGNFNKGIWAGWGVDMRDPTADRRLVEFCLAVPADQFLHKGQSRSLARRALEGRIPDRVLAERRRGLQAADWHRVLSNHQAALAAEVERIADCPAAACVLDIPRLRALVRDWRPGLVGQPGQEQLYRRAVLRAIAAGSFARSVS